MAEKAIEMIKYLPEVFGYFQGKKNIKKEVERLRNQKPIKQDRLQMDAALQNLNRAGNTTQTSVAQEGLERGVQQALANNPKNVNQLLDKLATGSAQISESDARQRNAINAQAMQGNQMLDARNSAIDRSNLVQDMVQEERVAGAEAAKNSLNMKGLSTLGSILGDSVGLIGNGPNVKSGMYEEPLGTTKEEVLDAFATEKRSPLSIADMTLDESKLEDIELEEEDIPLDFILPKQKSALEQYMEGDGQFQFLENKGSYNEGGAVVTPEGYDHDGVDIDMRDAQTGKMVGKVESAEMIVNSDDTEKGIRLAKNDPNNPLSKWYLSLTKRFREEAKNRK